MKGLTREQWKKNAHVLVTLSLAPNEEYRHAHVGVYCDDLRLLGFTAQSHKLHLRDLEHRHWLTELTKLSDEWFETLDASPVVAGYTPYYGGRLDEVKWNDSTGQEALRCQINKVMVPGLCSVMQVLGAIMKLGLPRAQLYVTGPHKFYPELNETPNYPGIDLGCGIRRWLETDPVKAALASVAADAGRAAIAGGAAGVSYVRGTREDAEREGAK